MELHETRRRPHQPAEMFRRIRRALVPFPRAMLFEIADEGLKSVFHQVCACIVSVRTLDEVSLPVSRRLLKRAPTPDRLLALSDSELLELLEGTTFPRQKKDHLRRIAEIANERFGGELPCERDALLALPGIGPKCANLVLGIACGRKAIGVDIHVHRVTNRWGYVSAPTAEKTLAQLEKILPERHWLEINELLVPFGKHICTGRLPRCSSCPVLEFCQQVGVERHR